MTTQEVYENLLRDAVSIYSKEGLKEKLESGRRLKIKLGADPSRPTCISAIPSCCASCACFRTSGMRSCSSSAISPR